MDGPLRTVDTTRNVGVLLFGPREVFCGADRAAFSYLLPGILSYPRYTTGHREAPMDPRNYHHHHQRQQQQHRHRLRSSASFHSCRSSHPEIVDAEGTIPRSVLSGFTEGYRGKFRGRVGTEKLSRIGDLN